LLIATKYGELSTTGGFDAAAQFSFPEIALIVWMIYKSVEANTKKCCKINIEKIFSISEE
jgi:hypothetical protein